MPAAAVTPAPIAYIKVVAVKKLVVGCDGRSGCRFGDAAVGCASRRSLPCAPRRYSPLQWRVLADSCCLTIGRICRGMVKRGDPSSRGHPQAVRGAFNRVSRATDAVYFEQNGVLKAGG